MLLHSKYQGSRPCGFKQEDFVLRFFSYISLCKTCDLRVEPFLPHGHNLNKLGRGPLDDATYQI